MAHLLALLQHPLARYDRAVGLAWGKDGVVCISQKLFVFPVKGRVPTLRRRGVCLPLLRGHNDGLLLLYLSSFSLAELCPRFSVMNVVCPALPSSLLSFFLVNFFFSFLVSLPEYTRQNEKEVGMKGIDSRLTGRLVV